MERLALALIIFGLVGCALHRPPDTFRDRLRACGTIIAQCGSTVW